MEWERWERWGSAGARGPAFIPFGCVQAGSFRRVAASWGVEQDMKSDRRYPTPIETGEKVLRKLREMSREEIEEAIDREGRRLQEAAARGCAQRREELARR